MIDLKQVIDENPKEMLFWARNVVKAHDNRDIKLSEREEQISEAVNGFVKDVWKFNSTGDKEKIAALVLQIIEPEIYDYPNEILQKLFDDAGAVGEYDKVIVRQSPLNTLVARQAAKNTGNVEKSYINFKKGNKYEDFLEIETELPLSNLRRDGAYGIALLTMYALEEFTRKQFKLITEFAFGLVKNGGDNYAECAGTVTGTAVKDLIKYLLGECVEGKPELLTLSDLGMDICDALDINYYSSDMKDELNNVGFLTKVRGADLVTIKKGKKTGDGSTLLPEDTILGFAGKIGKIYAAM